MSKLLTNVCIISKVSKACLQITGAAAGSYPTFLPLRPTAYEDQPYVSLERKYCNCDHLAAAFILAEVCRLISVPNRHLKMTKETCKN